MGIMNSALQMLSEIAIQESGVELPQEIAQDDLASLKMTLANIPMLEAKECKIIPEMIPIKESKRLGYYLIEMEDISRFMMTNGIRSFQEAVGIIAEANGIPEAEYSKIALVIDENSILDEIASLGVNIDHDFWTAMPKKGLGMPLIGQTQKTGEVDKLRRIANSKQMLDVLSGRYGLPLVKKNYKQVGLLENAEINMTGKNAVLNEKDKKDPEKTVVKEEAEVLNEGTKCSCGKADCPICNPAERKKLIDKGMNVRGKSCVKEDSDIPQMTAHEAYVQRIRDIASGKLDHELSDNGF